MIKENAIYFFQYLPPWRIDVFNELAKIYNLTVVFWNADCDGFTYNRQDLLSRLNPEIETVFLSNGINAGTHSIRRHVFDIIKRIKPIVVFSHEYAPISVQCVLFKKLKLMDYKVVITTSDNLKMANSVGLVKKVVRQFILKNSEGIILYSKDVELWYKKNFPWLKTDVCPNIQNPISLLAHEKYFDLKIEEFNERYGLNEKKIILYTGRLEYVKGLDLLLSVFSKIKKTGWRLVLVGEGTCLESLKKQTADLHIENSVVFAGFYSGVELYAWYRLANFFILPSRYEPFGAVVNESLVFGCPVVASKYIGALDFIDESNGLVFDPLSQNEFLDVMQQAMSKYSQNNLFPHNLMKIEFESSVAAFKRILDNV